MIELGYDVNTAGVRVSFVLRDGPRTPGVLRDAFTGLGLHEDGPHGGNRIIPQTAETLGTVMQILEAAREHEMACELHAKTKTK